MKARLPFCTKTDIEKALNAEWEKKIDELYTSVTRDVSAQLIAVCCAALNKNNGFGKKRLRRFYDDVNSMFLLFVRDGICGKEFTPVDCVEYLRDKYGIDVDKQEVQIK